MIAVAPSSVKRSMHRSQRTGLDTWATRRWTTSRPLVTTAPSRLDRSVTPGSDTSWSSHPASDATAGCMKAVWNAPATLRGMTRARAGGSAASAARASREPAATTCPAPLTFAGVRPCRSIVASTSASSPPRTALMPVGVAALASAIARPRWATKRIASVSRSTPAAAVAVISPTECPARAPVPAGATAYPPTVGVPESARRASSPAPTRSGWATAVSLMVSSSEVVPWVTRSTSAASERTLSWSCSPGSSSHGLRKPGVWEPWPGQTMTITGPA